MLANPLRVLLVADTHLGFDLPFRPRVERRRRGHDFFANFERALEPALQGEVDLVVHAGDLFYRSRVPAALIDMSLTPLLRVAEQGTPVFLVPGNHERSSIPLHLWTGHPRLHIFDQPRTYVCMVGSTLVAMSGFPFSRNIRDQFSSLVAQTQHTEITADICLLCMHQTVEGAQVGPGNYTFRNGPDVIPGYQVPSEFDAVLSGHIHRAQILRQDLACRPIAAPVVYAGSVERTSFAERDEEKSYAILRFEPDDSGEHSVLDAVFMPLPARPMCYLNIDTDTLGTESIADHLSRQLHALDPHAVVRVQLRGSRAERSRTQLTAELLRKLAPPTQNVSLPPERDATRERQS